MRILLSRTDSIGDVVLTLPMAGALKQSIPGCTVIFLGSEYTRPVVDLCEFVDEFVAWDLLPALPQTGEEFLVNVRADVIIHVFPQKEICHAAKRAGIPLRVATAGRLYTWLTCNKLLYIPRRNSDLHEAQLNLKLLRGLGVNRDFALGEVAALYGVGKWASGRADGRTGGQVGRRTVILHPKSKGSAREWGLENYSALIELLPLDQFNILITGTKEEGVLMAGFLEKHRDRITDLTGKLSLQELIILIGRADALVAASTGPLHIAAALGIRAVGLYAPMRPIFPPRWAPIGKNATFLVVEKKCKDCRKSFDCNCIRSITPLEVFRKLEKS